MFLSAAQFLETNKDTVNSLNVFPVPDGDTGTNMSLTMLSAAREIKAVESNDLSEVAEALSKGSLKGARGNSGVILSQLFRGFARVLKNEREITTKKYADALTAGVETAYKAVMKPVEGTILTVARVTAEEARKLASRISDFELFYDGLIDVAKETLDKTPDMLPVLKQAGVVDSGGMGLLYIMMGQARVFDDGFDLEAPLEQLDFYMDSNGIGNRTAVSAPAGFPEESIEFGYCTEFFITNLHPYIRAEDIDKLKAKLERLGDSIVVVGDEDLIKVHFHTNMPGKGLQLGLRFGELTNIKIDNMREQHHHVIEMETGSSTNEPEKNLGLVSVSMGEGIANVFKDLNADYIIEGGQTMNPSIEDILNAVEKVNAREVFVLPNNSNIVLSAKQAAEISKKPIHVVPTKTIPQGLAALIAYNPENDVQTNKNNMTEAIKQVKSGQITYAVRNSRVDEIEIKEGNIMGIMDGNISMVGENIADVTKQLLDRMLEDGGEIVTVFYGSDAAKEDTESIRAYLQEKHNDVDVELLFGGQPLYYYILSVE
ncbi:MAG TPA: DAK2 domain-containing protein [Clostridiales bacterium]|nr:DAK2 domain-containing protein [Clostridiales bacterium]